VPIGIETMGFYRAKDRLSFYRAVADAFTICDRYHCSVIGPTHPNRLVSVSGSLGAHSRDTGGPVLTTYVQKAPQVVGTLSWPTFPELLTEHGVTWKVYQAALFNVLGFFKQYAKPTTTRELHNAALGLAPVYPAEFAADVLAGTLPKVSWIMPPAPNCEHPGTPPEFGEYLVAQILDILTKNPAIWQHTVFIVNYDENGGFFDHVAPATPGPTVTKPADIPAGAQYDGEYVTTTNPTNAAGGPPSNWDGVLGPVGLGFRTPCLVISPFSAGGHVVSDLFDHVSVLKFIEKRFAPGAITGNLHLSSWRYGLVGDMTSTLPLLSNPNATVPSLPKPSMTNPQVFEQSVLNSFAGVEDDAAAYPPPPANSDDFKRQD